MPTMVHRVCTMPTMVLRVCTLLYTSQGVYPAVYLSGCAHYWVYLRVCPLLGVPQGVYSGVYAPQGDEDITVLTHLGPGISADHRGNGPFPSSRYSLGCLRLSDSYCPVLPFWQEVEVL